MRAEIAHMSDKYVVFLDGEYMVGVLGPVWGRSDEELQIKAVSLLLRHGYRVVGQWTASDDQEVLVHTEVEDLAA